MRFFINTNKPNELKSTILSCIKNKNDKSDSEIKTWDLRNDPDDKNNKLLVHTTEAWDAVGSLSIDVDEDNKRLEVKFYYWDTYPQEKRTHKEKFYLYGRVTELLLAHFGSSFSSIKIEP